MNERKNIDRLFQEKFKDFEAAPPEHVWKNIEAELRKDKDDRKVLPFWFRLSGIAAALLIGLIITDNVVTNSNQNPIVIEQSPQGIDIDSIDPTRDGLVTSDADANRDNVDDDSNSRIDPIGSTDNESADSGQRVSSGTDQGVQPRNREQLEDENKAVVISPDNKGKKARATRPRQGASEKLRAPGLGKTTLAQSESNAANAVTGSSKESNMYAQPKQETIANTRASDGVIAEQNRSNDNILTTDDNTTEPRANQLGQDAQKSNTIIADITADDTKIDTAAIATVVPNTLEELLNEKENNVTTNEPKLNRWQVSTNVAPIYFSSTSNGSPIDPTLAQNSKDYKQNVAYGLGVRYAINDKFTVRTGVNSIGLEYTTNDVVFYQNTSARPLQHVSTNLQGSFIQIESKDAAGTTVTTPGVASLTKFDANINQKTGYIEVPVELAYKVVDKKFGVEIIGGVSTLFLNENSISMTSAGTEMEIGKANNLNSTHFSTNIGLGVKYNFFKSFQVNVEPMFKYQINTFSDSGNFKPYFFGLYTGINYRF